MAKGLNKVQIIGYLGRDPEMRYTAQGTAVTNINVAVSRSWKEKDGTDREETEWFRVVAWDKLGEICNQYLTKGRRVYFEGRLQTRKYTDREGVERFSTDVIATDMVMLDAPNKHGSAPDSEERDYEDQDEAPAPARRAPVGAANGSGSRPSAPPSTPAASRPPARSPARNQPQPIESDDEIPF